MNFPFINKKKKDDSLRVHNSLRSSLLASDFGLYDPIKNLQISSIKSNFIYLNKNQETFLIRPAFMLDRYLTTHGRNQLVDFQERQIDNKYQEYIIQVYPMTSGIEYTIHPKSIDEGLLGDAILNGDESKHYVSVFSKDSDMFTKNWNLPIVDKDGIFNIINSDAFIYTPPKNGIGYGTFTSRAIQVLDNFTAGLNAEEKEDLKIKRAQSFIIELVKSVSISDIEYLVEDEYKNNIEVERLEDEEIRRAYINNRNTDWEQTVTFDDIKLRGKSSFEEYKGILFNISDLKSTKLKSPEIFDGELQKDVSINSEALSYYLPDQTIERKVLDLTFKFEVPSKTKMVLLYKIPKYGVSCPYKLTLKLNDENVFLTVYGYWKGIVYSVIDAEDPEINLVSKTNRSSSICYRLPIKSIKKNELIKLSTLKEVNYYE